MTLGETTFDSIVPMHPVHWGELVVGDVLYPYEGARLHDLAMVCPREKLPERPRPLDRADAVRWSTWVHLEAPLDA